LNETSYFSAAAATLLTLPLINLQELVIFPQLPIDIHEIGYARSTMANGTSQYLLNRADQALGFVPGYRRTAARRVEPCLEKGLTGIDIAQSGNPPLIEKI
jgi:hypothetical protein